MIVGGTDRAVDKVRIVFTQEAGARGSLADLERWFEEYGRVLEVEIIGESGSRLCSDFDRLSGAL